MRVLIIDDNTDLTTSLNATLTTAGFVIDVCNDGPSGFTLARVNDYDAIVLDYNLPGLNGDEICQTLRAKGKFTPIIVLSVLGGADLKVRLLDCGADDYLTKPFSARELIARLHALGRRHTTIKNPILQLGDLTLNTQQYYAKRGKKNLHLTPKEFKLLELLLNHTGEVVSRATLLEHVWDEKANPLSNSLDMHISALRKKIDRSPKNSLIKTIPGIGYKIGVGV